VNIVKWYTSVSIMQNIPSLVFATSCHVDQVFGDRAGGGIHTSAHEIWSATKEILPQSTYKPQNGRFEVPGIRNRLQEYRKCWFNQLLPLNYSPHVAHIFVCLIFLLLFHEIPLLIALIPFPPQILSHVPPVSLLRRWRSNKPCRRFPEIWVPQTICLSVFHWL
jgi:hypothetical protein